jgi:hypothetical protein
MRRIILVVTVALVMAAMMPAFAYSFERRAEEFVTLSA